MEVSNGATKTVTMEVNGLVTAYSDGSLYRSPLPSVEPYEEPLDGVACRDVLINKMTGVKVRIYLACSGREPLAKSPLLFYFHPGGFCLGSTSLVEIHNFLQSLCKTARAMVVSVDYRRSPEHRLPAAYDDCVDAISWVAKEEDEWISNYADLTKCFICGDSSGGNIVHQIIIQMASPAAKLRPKLLIRGYVLIQPFFGSETKTEYELSCIEQGEPYVMLSSWYDMFWELSLPEGADRDSPFCNPWVGSMGHVKPGAAAAMLVAVAELDLLRERGLSYAELARTQMNIKDVEVVVAEGQHHGYHLLQLGSPQSDLLINRIALFIDAHSAKSEQDCCS
ncbi:putative carboxylesterase 17 [Nymphaea thermarum]|nr:putative carboxylesterase 17 [Nymphaea thermarum]